MASRAAIEAANAFVKFTADLSSLPGDFKEAENRFKEFKERINNKSDALSNLRADLDTRAAEGKLTQLQTRLRNALDPKGAPLLAGVASDLDARIDTLLPRLQKLFEPPTARRAEIEKRIKADLDHNQDTYARASIQLAKRRIDLEGQLAREVEAAAATKGKSARVDAVRDAIKAADNARAELTKGYTARAAAIVDAGRQEADAYDARIASIRNRVQREVETLAAQRRLLQQEYVKFDKARQEQRQTTSQGAAQDAAKLQQAEAAAFSKGLEARLNAESQATQERIAEDIKSRRRKYAQLEKELSQREATEAAEAARRQRELPSRLAGFAQDLQQVGAGLFGAGVTGLAGFGLAAREFAELDKSLRTIKGVSSASDIELRSLETTIRKLGATTSFTTREVANAALELARGGQAAAEIRDTLPSVLDLARGTGSDLAFSAQSVVRTLGQFQLATKDSGRVVDALAASANAGTLDLQDLGESMKFLGSIAETTGESVETAGAAFAVMANNGLRGGLAGRQLRRVFYELADPMKRLKVLQETGVDTFDAEGNLRPIADLVEEIGEAIDKLPSGKKVAFLDNAFGEGAAAFEALSKGREEFRGLIAEVQAAEGYARSLAKEVDGGLAGAFLIAVSATQDLGIEIGKILGPLLTQLAEWMQSTAATATKWASENRTLVQALAVMTAGVTALGAALLGLGVAVGTIAAVAGMIAFLRSELVKAQLAALVLSGPKGIAYALAAVATLAGLSYAAAAALDNQAAAQVALGANTLETTDKVARLTRALQDLAASGDFNAGKGLEKFRNTVKALESELGPLGAKFDEVTGKPLNAPEVAGRAGLIASLKEQRNELDTNRQGVKSLEQQLEDVQGRIQDINAAAGEFGSSSYTQAALMGANQELEGINRKLQESGLEARQLMRDIEGLEDQLAAMPPVEIEVEAKVKGAGGIASAITAAGALAAGRLGPMLATAFDSATGNAVQDIQRNGFNASPLSSIGSFLKDSVEDFRSNNLNGAFDSLASALGVGADQVAGSFNWFAAAARSTISDNLTKKAEDLVGRFDLGGISRQGAFGVEEAQRQVNGQTTDVLGRVLAVEERQEKLLVQVRDALKQRAGLVGK